MTEEEMKKLISKAAQKLLDNWDELIEPDIPHLANDCKELIELCKSGKYTKEELKKIADEKAEKYKKK